MPVYDFEHLSETGSTTISVYLDLNQPAAAYREQVRDGVVYKRVYTVPTASIDTKRNDCTKEDYRRTTTGKNMTVGEMADMSREMSRARAEKEGGRDLVKESYYKRYEKDVGEKHQDVKKREAAEKANKALKKIGVKVNLPTT